MDRSLENRSGASRTRPAISPAGGWFPTALLSTREAAGSCRKIFHNAALAIQWTTGASQVMLDKDGTITVIGKPHDLAEGPGYNHAHHHHPRIRQNPSTLSLLPRAENTLNFVTQ